MSINLLKRLGRWVKVEPAAPATLSGVQKVTAEEIMAEISNVDAREAAFIAAMENGEIGPEGDVVVLEESDGGV